ncbi:unnamed protein product [Somion occarium]|uniref:Uncharacterized protein n=1 Tax=Somion occarium TaxID=3059160 RepID=A0ABP1CT67_9APHY
MMRASRYCSKMPQFPSSAATASSLVFLAIYMLMPPAFPFPPITVFQAHLLAAFFTFSYVGSLYISKNARLRFSSKAVDTSGEMPRTREEEERWRDDPDVIKARLLAASLSTFVDCAAVFLLFWHLDGGRKALIRGSLSGVLIRLGFRSSKDAAEALLPCLTAPALFIGPIYVCFLSSTLPFQSEWSVRGTLLPIIWSWQGWRNYFVVGSDYRGNRLSGMHPRRLSRRRCVTIQNDISISTVVRRGAPAPCLGRLQPLRPDVGRSQASSADYIIPAGLHYALWLSLRIPIPTHRIFDSTDLVTYFLQHHGFAWIRSRSYTLPT